MQYIALAAVILSLAALNALPLAFRLYLVHLGVKVYAGMSPAFNAVSVRNIGLVCPEFTPKEVLQLLRSSKRSLARFIVDSARFHTLNDQWVRQHVECPFKEKYKALKEKNPAKGILTVSGHLGSIEIQALCAPVYGRKFSFVARSLKHAKIDAWWRGKREKHGNQVIAREGAVKKIIENLNSGKDVAILIDQNVKRKHALFVDWFGRPAATTFACGHAAVETRCPVILSAISYIGDEKYRVNEHECDLTDIYEDASLDKEAQVFAVTKRVSEEYQKIIRLNLNEWFWMHRRWKTTPEGMPEDFYGVLPKSQV